VTPQEPTVGKLLGGFASVDEWENISSHQRSLGGAISPGLHMVKFAGTATRTNAGTRKTFNGYNMSEVGTVAFLTDLGDDFDKQSYASVSMKAQINGSGSQYTIASKTGLATDTSNPITKRTGRFWTSGRTSLQAVIDAGVGNHRFIVDSTQQNGPKTGDISFGRIYSGVGGKGAHLFRFDDAKVEAYTVFFPIMQARGIVGELHLVPENIGTAGHLTVPMILEMIAAGWSIQMNGTANDQAMTSRNSLDDCILELKDIQQWIVQTFNVPEPIAFNYPFGSKCSVGAQVYLVVTTLGNAVSVPSTAGIVQGMRFLCYGVEDVTRVLAVDAANNSVTLDKPVRTPVTGIDGRFINDSGAFHGDKLQRRLLAEEFKWGWTTANAPLYLQYGIEDTDTIQANCNTWTQTQSYAAFATTANNGVLAGNVVAWYIHQYSGPELPAIMDHVKAHVDAGRAYVATTPILERLHWNARPPLAA
jgi:hypothetical protein